MANLGQQLMGAVQALSSNEVSQVHFDKTVRATIIEVTDASIGKYKVRYQNSVFYAYSPEAKTYVKNSQVYVVLPSKDLEKHPRIVDSVKKLGSNFIETIEPEDRMMKIGTNIFNFDANEKLLSYHSDSRKVEGFFTDKEAINTYKKNADYILIAAKFKTNLPAEQQVGGGDYGIKVKTKFYNDNFKSLEAAKDAEKAGSGFPENEIYKYKEYVLKTASMRGQPYRFTVGSRQYAIFEIKGENFIDITEITVYNKNFPISKKIKEGYYDGEEGFYRDSEFKNRIYPARDSLYFYDIPSKKYYRWINTDPNFFIGHFKELADSEYDIEISDFEFYFLDALTDEELQGISLRVGTPKGSYFYSQDSSGLRPQPETGLELAADLRVRGKRVNYDQQKVNFYWFIKDARVGSDNTYYSPYGGTGWKCLNDCEFTSTEEGNKQQTIFIPDTYSKTILYEENKDGKIVKNINEYENIFKCVAIFKNDNASTSVSSVVSLYDKTKGDMDVNDVYIFSTSGTEFNFDGGATTLKCLLKDDPVQEKYNEKYNFYWCYSNDGGPESEPNSDEEETGYAKKVSIGENVRYFTTYSCTVYKKEEITGEDGEIIGSASITLNNEENPSKYTLVLRNGVKTFKFTEEGISPVSLALDEYDRIDLPALTFDIYDNNGNLIEMSNVEKQYYCDITWVWPSLHTNEGDDKDYNPKSQTKDFDSMLLPTDLTGEFTLQELPDIYHDENIKRRWIVKNQAVLPYSLQNNYDIEKTNNTVFLEVDYQGQQLRAHTNFSFIKDGDLGTNGTRFITKLLPLPKYNNDYKQIIIYKNLEEGYVFGGVKYSDQDNEIVSLGGVKNPIQILKGQIWDGGPSPYKDNIIGDASVKWSILTQGRKDDNTLFIKPDGTSNGYFSVISGITPIQNNTIQFEYTSSELAENVQKYNASYPLDYVDCTTGLGNILIKGGYRTCNYANDGTRSGFSQQPFSLIHAFNTETVEDIDSKKIRWNTSWGGIIKTAELKENSLEPVEKNVDEEGKVDKEGLAGFNNVIIEPPIQYTGENVNHYITCEYTFENNSVGEPIYTTIAVVSVIFYLNRYGLGGIQDWDGNSIKLNNEGNNYILAPQVGAGERNTEGQFTGVTIGKEFNNNNGTVEKNIGLLGYHNGERSILLDSKTGSAEFGKNGAAQIKIDATTNEGSIYSGDYGKNDDYRTNPKRNKTLSGTGMKIKFSSTKDQEKEKEGYNTQGPYIRFGSGNFYVTPDGHIHAAGGGDIAGWKIDDTSIYYKNGNKKPEIFLRSDATIKTDLKTGNFLYYDPSNESGSSIPVFKAVNFEIYRNGCIRNTKDNFYVTETGYLYAKNGGNVAGWEISSDGLFKDNVRIISSNNEDYKVDGHGHKRIDIWNGANNNFYVTDQGYLFSQSGKIAGWDITSNKISKNKVSINSNHKTEYDENGKLTNSTPAIKAGSFEIYDDGRIQNTSGTFSVSKGGKIKATAGTIGGWDINNTSLSSKNNNIIISSAGSGSIIIKDGGNEKWKITGDDTDHFGKFKVTNSTVIIDEKGKLGTVKGKWSASNAGSNGYHSGANNDISGNLNQDSSSTVRGQSNGVWSGKTTALTSINLTKKNIVFYAYKNEKDKELTRFVIGEITGGYKHGYKNIKMLRTEGTHFDDEKIDISVQR